LPHLQHPGRGRSPRRVLRDEARPVPRARWPSGRQGAGLAHRRLPGADGLMPARSIDEVLALFETWGVQRYDEDVTQLDHALQTAALARDAGATDELVAAALLHDVGHLLELRAGGRADGQVEVDLGHEGRGARY